MSILTEQEAQSNYDFIAELGTSFREYRKNIKVSQKQLHEKTGLSIFTISAFENGKGQGLSLSHFMMLLNAVGMREKLRGLFPETYPYDLEKMWKQQNKKTNHER